jgi:uncharacterized protein YbjT (DUF2867 family)
VVIAGATGFVGRALARALAPDHHVVGLSRGASAPDADVAAWRACDLFSLLDAERALEGADLAVYLVHSMMPSAHLTQGGFRDFDLVCADNFARAARKAGARQIVYLGGLTPPGQSLSAHLESRLEVERALEGYGVPVTTLRAGLVLGPGGSSFEMLRRLVERLPAMLCPAWTSTRMQPIALADVVSLLRYVLGREACFGQNYDVGSPDVLNYRELIGLTGELLGRRRATFAVPFLTVGLSRLWVRLITGAPLALVGPLVESLAHEMVAGDRRLQAMADVPGLDARAALALALAPAPPVAPKAYRPNAPGAARRVRSVQRMRLPPGRDAAWAAEEYVRWLPTFFRGLLRVEVDAARVCRFRLVGVGVVLELTPAPARSTPDRQLFYVTGGLLARPTKRARFELRQVLDGTVLLAAIHDFEPRLPWPIYTLTQAPFHKHVMLAFGRHLARGHRALASGR